MKRVNTFVDMDTELVKGSEVRAEGSETRAEGSSKIAGEDLQQESTKKQKMDDEIRYMPGLIRFMFLTACLAI
ncbi:hypothetical protein Tco_0787769 [Tanacetum coccineum]